MKVNKKITNILRNRVIQNAGWLVFGKIAQMCINLFVGLLTARYLGPSNYGLINYGSAYTAFFLNLCTLGINSVLVKEFVDHSNEEGKIIGTTLCLKGVASVLSAISIVLISAFIDADEPVTRIVVALCSVGLVFNILDTFNYWFQARLQSKIIALASLVSFTVTAIYKVYIIVCDKSVVFFAFATSIDYICIGLILMYMYKKCKGGKLSFSFSYAKELLKSSTPFIIPGIMVAVYGQTDKMMLKQMISDAEIGYYATAVSICTMWCFVLNAIIDSMYPVIMEANKKDKVDFIYKNKLLYAIIFYCCMFVSVGITILAELIVKILYGSAYLPTVNPLRIITWYTAFSYLGMARNAWIVCENKQKYLTPVYAASAIANIIFNVIFIPLWGASGAAFASLIAEAFTTIVVPFMIPGLRENSKLMIEAVILKGIIKKNRRVKNEFI